MQVEASSSFLFIGKWAGWDAWERREEEEILPEYPNTFEQYI